jgi:uncharacterized membrane-anchored protein
MRRSLPNPIAAKVPELTILFWIVKLITTGIGEATSDYLGEEHLIIAGIVCGLVFPFSLWLQLRSRTYFAPIYWFAVTMVAVFGTVVADGLHVGLGIPYVATSSVCIAALAFTFWRWNRSELTVSIHSIVTRRRERYYWTTVLLTFALGTALGDMTAREFGWGYLASIPIFAALFLIPGALRWTRMLGSVPAFWGAYIVTRPLGASVADWIGKPTGLGYGDGLVALVGMGVIALLVAWLTWRRSDVQEYEILTAASGPVPNPEAHLALAD